ncbi:MAG: type II secretion system F family protein [Pseudonocardiales bacterium]|nr:type II secretion system F family protein [Pseudonocardiales bacterium]
MSSSVALLALLGLGVGVGLLILVFPGHATPAVSASAGRWVRWWTHQREQRSPRWLLAAGAAAIGVGALTGWIVGALLAAMAVWGIPRIFAANTDHERQIARIEAIAGWTEMLRDTLAAAAGLEQAITATARTAPMAIRPQILEVAARLTRGDRLTAALRWLASELADPTADLVIAALILSAEHQARQLAPLLGQLAETARGQVEMRQRVETSRARTRTTMRVVVVTTVCFAGGLILFNPAFLAPYGSPVGQLVLLGIGAIFTLAFVWMARLARIEEPERFLTELDTIPAAGHRQGAIKGATP